MLLLAEDYAAMGVSERNMFGNLIGRGEMGYIFDYTGNPNLVIKLVQIRPYVDGEVRPFRETFLHIRSSRAKKIAINELQANLFRKMEQSPVSDHLPQIFEFSYGGVTLELREALKHSYQTYGWSKFGGYNALKSVLKEFRIGNRYAYWIMEKIPCTSVNDWCDRGMENRNTWTTSDYIDRVPAEQRAYQSLVQDLYYYTNTVVRDMASVTNLGFRESGEPVWIDPIVSSWPITADMEDSPLLEDREKFDLFVAAFNEAQIFLYQEALDNNQYFSYRHEQGALMAEGEL